MTRTFTADERYDLARTEKDFCDLTIYQLFALYEHLERVSAAVGTNWRKRFKYKEQSYSESVESPKLRLDVSFDHASISKSELAEIRRKFTECSELARKKHYRKFSVAERKLQTQLRKFIMRESHKFATL